MAGDIPLLSCRRNPWINEQSIFFRTKAAALTRRREKIPDHRLNYVPSRSVIEFGNSPLVTQHLKMLTSGGNPSVAPIRLQVITIIEVLLVTAVR